MLPAEINSALSATVRLGRTDPFSLLETCFVLVGAAEKQRTRPPTRCGLDSSSPSGQPKTVPGTARLSQPPQPPPRAAKCRGRGWGAPHRRGQGQGVAGSADEEGMDPTCPRSSPSGRVWWLGGG